jgi:hypothetical protein
MGCVQCSDGFQVSPSRCECMPCLTGSAGTGGVCAACKSGEEPNLARDKCVKCTSGKVSQNGLRCIKCPTYHFTTTNIDCVKAGDGKQPVSDGSGELPCPAGSAGIGGMCSQCAPGSVPNKAQTKCEKCGRLRYDPGGEGCIACDIGTVPSNVAGATFCVSCSLQGSAKVQAVRYQNTDWAACSMSTVICNPGEQPSANLASCDKCTQDNTYSPSGVSCSVCKPGKQPNSDRTRCDDCRPGQVSTRGVCTNCSDLGDNRWSSAAATKCQICGEGTEPAQDRSKCITCPDGTYSPYGVCKTCKPGSQSSDKRDSCISCETVSDAAFSSNGASCRTCKSGTMPSKDRSKCVACPSGLLGYQGRCSAACQTLGCANITATPDSGKKYATVTRISQLCKLAPGWLNLRQKLVTNSIVTSPPGLCKGDYRSSTCSVKAPVSKRTRFAIEARAGKTSSTCTVEIYVKEARVAVTPTSINIDSLTTAHGEATLRVDNMGDDTVVVFAINLGVKYISVSEIKDAGNVPVSLPATVPAKGVLTVTLRGEGTSVPFGNYKTNGTVLSSTGTEKFDVLFKVTEASLRVIALPALLPTAKMRSGPTEKMSTLFTIYNVDTSDIYWMIKNCTRTSDPRAAVAPYSFSLCRSPAPLRIGKSQAVRLTFTAPNTVGEYFRTHDIVGGSQAIFNGDLSAASAWNIDSHVVVSANVIVLDTSSAQFAASLVAGRQVQLVINPKDAYGNQITTYGMNFHAAATETRSASAATSTKTFKSTFDFDKDVYSIEAVLMKATAYKIVVTYSGKNINSLLDANGLSIPAGFVTVAKVTCDKDSLPNKHGNACLCRVGMARVDGKCTTCQPGFAPKRNRELGCDQCRFYPGTASTDGLACKACSVGLRPSVDYTSCNPCPQKQYYDRTTQVCMECKAGEELSKDPTKPCQRCDKFSAGLTGTCAKCEDGKHPNLKRTSCIPCAPGSAGQSGECKTCIAGKAQNAKQTACDTCLPETYRSDLGSEECALCPEGMTSDAGSVAESDCRCPEGQYDVQDAAGTYSPIYCWPSGLGGNAWVLDDNKISVGDIKATQPPNPRSAKRCVACPDCIDCRLCVEEQCIDGECSCVGKSRYRGKPYIRADWALYDEEFPTPVEPFSSALAVTTKQTVGGEIMDHASRNVLKCPFSESCLDEFEFRYNRSSEERQPCTAGYTGAICSRCDNGWSAGKKGKIHSHATYYFVVYTSERNLHRLQQV